MIRETGRELLIQFGDHLRKLRLSKNLSYRQMSRLCNVDYSNIRRIEQGEINATFLTLTELAKALEIEPEELMKFKK